MKYTLIVSLVLSTSSLVQAAPRDATSGQSSGRTPTYGVPTGPDRKIVDPLLQRQTPRVGVPTGPDHKIVDPLLQRQTPRFGVPTGPDHKIVDPEVQ
jgi:hypothetical protein